MGADRLRRVALRRPRRAVRRHDQPVAHLPASPAGSTRQQPLRHRRHPRPHARRHLAAHRPDDPPARPRRHQPRRPGDPRHRRRVPHRHEGRLRAPHRRRLHASSSPPTTRSGRARAAGSRRKDLDRRRRSPPARASPPCVQEIGEPQDPQFFQLLGLFLSRRQRRRRRAAPRRLPRRATTRSTTFARYVAETLGRRARTPTITSTSAMLDGGDDDGDRDDGDTLTATLTNRRLLSRLKAFVRTDDGAAAASATKPSPPASPRRSTCSAACSPPTASVTNDTLELHQPNRSAARRRAAHPARLRHPIRIIDTRRTQHSTLAKAEPSPAEACPDDGGLLRSTRLRQRGRLQAVAATSRGDAASRRHGLRIDPGSLRSFGKHVGLLPGTKLEQLADADQLRRSPAHGSRADDGNCDRVAVAHARSASSRSSTSPSRSPARSSPTA